MNRFSHFECSGCNRRFGGEKWIGLCPDCSRPLLVRYRLDEAFSPSDFDSSRKDLWRYAPLLPSPRAGIVSLGEGRTPLFEASSLARHAGGGRWWIKDEGRNPTGSFKARGMAVAVSMARGLGARSLFAPSAGNAGVALAAYGRQAGLPVTLAFPQGTPAAILDRSRDGGATVQIVPGSIADAGKKLREQFADAVARGEAFDLSTFREPFRVEGKKTMGFEIYEQLENRLPDAIVYPLGGGTGLVALEKAFDEMEALSWNLPKRPRLYAVQAEGCAPIVRAFDQGESVAKPIENPSTAAHGLRVPATLADALCLRALRRSGGAAISVSEEEIEAGVGDLRLHADLQAAPEAGAALAGACKLLAQGRIQATDEVVIFATAAASVYES